jgi:protein TonB
VDLSRAPRLANAGAWDCPFPNEADDLGIDRALVSLEVRVAEDGHALATTVTSDPGSGFAREAQRCALRKRWSPGLDRAGHPRFAIAFVNVRFDR